jgi:hypothetical protein
MASGDPAKAETQGQSTLPTLLALTPKYEEGSHRVYVDAIEGGLKGPESGDVKNIALTGGYGVGKSSVLQKVAENHKDKVVQVSLSTLGFEGDPNGTGEESRTNQIQKEIVKQLLYQEEPAKMPGSRFRRIGRFKKSRALGIAALLGIVLVAVFYLSGWTAQLAALFPAIDLGLWDYVVLWGLFTLGGFATLALLHNRFQIRQVKVADADISLAEDASSYFDQYLDEIVYFFDVTERDIVIFEDIDRFGDAHIFETLRALNTLLNGAGQLKKRRIRFIYAIKDSIFVQIGKLASQEEDEDDEEQAEPTSDLVVADAERANRTKFFDLVVPVVPFITHRNARNLMDDVLRGINGTISSELIDLAARHVTDMRLIKNVRNEFIIFKDKVFQTDDGGELALSDDGLFAMMLYKSTHLADFEGIKTGRSKLDDLYEAHGQIVSTAISALNQEARTVRNQLTHLTTVDTRSQKLADELAAYADRIGRHLGMSGATTVNVSFGGQPQSVDDLRAPAFWRAFADGTGQIDVSFVRSGAQRAQISISRDDAAAEFGDDLTSAAHWDAANRAPLQERLTQITQERTALEHSDMAFLIEHDDYVDEGGKTFRELTESLESDLARQLVAAGYIGRDFTLYTSSYYSSRISTRAQNFLMHSVDRGVMDANYRLEPADVAAIIQDRGDTVLREHGMYNISVVDYLLAPKVDDEEPNVLEERSRQGTVLVRSLIASGDDEMAFFDAYFLAGGQRDALVRKLAERWPGVFNLVISRSDVDEDERIALFNSALESMSDGVRYQVGGKEFRPFVEQNFAKIPVLTSKSTSADSANRVAAKLAEADVRLTSLKPLGKESRRAVVEVDAYEINRENLILANGNEALALDELRSSNKAVYKYALSDLGAYLLALDEKSKKSLAIAGTTDLAAMVVDLVDADLDRLDEILGRAARGAAVESLSTVPAGAWPALADHQDFPVDLANVTAYISTIGEIDEHLAGALIDAKSIVVPEESDQDALIELAGQLLSASDTIPDPATRVALVVSLGLDNWLPLTSVRPEKGKLVGLLIEHEVIDDDVDSFALALAQDWATREFAISKSEKFATYVTTTELPSLNVASLMGSALIADEVKDLVLTRADEFIPTDDRTALTGLAEYAVRKGTKLPVPLVARMASAGVGVAIMVRLLGSVAAQVDASQLSSILTSFGGEYAAASTRNGKRPKLPNTAADMAIVQRLEDVGLANSHSVSGSKIKVNMKQG